MAGFKVSTEGFELSTRRETWMWSVDVYKRRTEVLTTPVGIEDADT